MNEKDKSEKKGIRMKLERKKENKKHKDPPVCETKMPSIKDSHISCWDLRGRKS